MAAIVVVGSVASDEPVRLAERLREGAHLNGRGGVARLGGGGANTAVALAAAGHRVSLVTAVGDDADGTRQLHWLTEAGVDVGAVVRMPGPSTRSILLLDPGGERTIVNLGRVKEPEPPRRLLDLAADLVYVRTRAVGLAALLVEKAAVSLIVAHVPPLERGVFPAHVIVCSASDLDDGFLADPVAGARLAAGALLRWVVVTHGPAGAEAFSVDGARFTVPAPAAEALDSTGAGDAFAAGLCHGLASGVAMPEAVAQAVRWGAEKVRRDGSALPADAVRALIR
ncbi:MAG: carbohydrate kinase [Magnetospirillum sp.]|nr:carbohydrate kinase [Magnetospirillum sp.]